MWLRVLARIRAYIHDRHAAEAELRRSQLTLEDRLVVNAAHAIGDVVGPSGARGQITVSTWHDGSEVVIAIADTGTGIPPNIRNQVFDPFFTIKPVGRGTGQGLSLARAVIVEKHRGSLTFETSPAGTTFYIRLPVEAQAVLAA